MWLRRPRGRSFRTAGKASELDGAASETDMSEYVVIPATTATAFPDRQLTLRQEEPFQIQLIEDQIVQSIKENDGRKSAVISEMRCSADYLDKQQRDMNIAKTSFASGGIAASILAIVGLALAPVSAGTTLGLTAAGIALGVASGTGGVATEIADKAINNKALKKAQSAINNYNNKNMELLQLMNTVRERSGDQRFRKFVEEKLRMISPRFYEWFNKHMRNEIKPKSCNPEPAKTGARVAAAAGKIASEVFETGGKAIKFGSLVCSVFTIPLDLHTIVSNSIKIHKRTPSETAEHIRKLADDLESEGQLDEKEELKRKAEKLEREVNRQQQQWMYSMGKIGEDVAMKMEELAMLYDFVKKEVLRIQIVSLFAHMAVRPLALILPYLFMPDSESWLYWGAFVSLLYDGFYLLLSIAMEAYVYWIVCQSNKEIEKGLYAAGNLFNTAPQTVLSSAERKSRSFHAIPKPELKDCIAYYNVFDSALVALKTLLNLVILWRFGYFSDRLVDIVLPSSPSTLSYVLSWLWLFPLSEPVVRLDLVIFWLAVCSYLLTSAMKEHKEGAQSLLAKDVVDLGENFKRSLNELVSDCNTDINQNPVIQSNLSFTMS